MLIEFLTDVVVNMDSFRDDIVTLYLFNEKGKLIATGNHPKLMVLYRAAPIEDLTQELAAPAYLGALGYLRSLLGSSLMKDNPSVEITYRERDGKKDCVTSMRFVSKRLDAHFECTNPEIINQAERKSEFLRPTDDIHFSFTKEIRKEFDEVARFNTPKSDTRLFTLVFDGNYLRAIFGTGKHTTNLILTDTINGNTENKIQKLISLDRFRSMIRLVSDNDGRASFHPNAFWVDFSTPHAIHKIVIPTIRDQVK